MYVCTRECSFPVASVIITMHSYVLVTCMGTGAPWSEQREGTTFQTFLQDTLQQDIPNGIPCEDQDAEFCCAYPSRNGSTCLQKGSSACNVPVVAESPRVIIAIRAIGFPQERPEVRESLAEVDNATKFWVAIRAPDGFKIPPELGNGCTSPYR